MKAVSKVRAPARPTGVIHAVIADTAGAFFKSSEPYFTAGTVADVANHLRGLGFPVVVRDELGDFDNFSSLADGAAHVLDRTKRIRAAL